MSQPVGSPRPVVTPTRTKTSSATPTKSGTKSPAPKPARTDTDQPVPRGSGGPNGATTGATKTRVATPTKVRSTATPTKVRTATPTKANPSAPLSDRAKELRDLALETRRGRLLVPLDGRVWDPDNDDLTKAHNAHHSNTPEEMRDALEHDYNWLEGDLRVDARGELVMAHDSDKKDSGLKLDEWLAIGGAGERGLKVDVKEAEAIPKLLETLEASDIPDGRIMLNVSTSQVDADDVREMRRRFPDAWLALNPSPGDDNDYGPDDLKQVTDLADTAGGRVAFPLRWDLVTDDVIETLKPHGKVSIWTSKSEGTPDHPGSETRKLRDRGVDGVIDLGPPQSVVENLAERGQDLWESGPVRGARDLIGGIPGALGDAWGGVKHLGSWFGDRGSDALDFGGDVIDGAGDVLDSAGDLGGDILSGAGDIAEDLPLVGGIFG
ncbi:MAG: hypothetical protein JWL76_1682 [Thermoleophilia bacterium]|nr:hypothetical protein [Thermoleophilia bacterium]